MNEYGSSDDVTKSFDSLHQNVSPENHDLRGVNLGWIGWVT